MRYLFRLLLLPICCFIILQSGRNLHTLQSKYESYENSYMISLADPPSYEKDLPKKNSAILEKHPDLAALFWGELPHQYIYNPAFNREAQGRVISCVGNSALLFPDAHPLLPSDVKGCLISTSLAYALFGGTDVTGQGISYGGKEYLVRGTMDRLDSLLVLEWDPAEYGTGEELPADAPPRIPLKQVMLRKQEKWQYQDAENLVQGIYNLKVSAAPDTLRSFLIQEKNVMEVYVMNLFVSFLQNLFFLLFALLLLALFLKNCWINKPATRHPLQEQPR